MNIYKKYWMSIRKRLRLARNERFFIKNVDDVLFLLDIKNRVDRHIDVSESYEPEQVKYLFQLLQNSVCNVFVDIGAHWGYYSVLMAKQEGLKGVDIHAFEPGRINRYQLYANLFLNKLEQVVKVYECGLSDYNGNASFHNYHEGNRGRSHISAQGMSNIEVKCLDDVLPIKGKVVGVKIDVEGHEFNVIAGMKELLENNKCILQIESFEDVLPALSQQLKKAGYKHINCIESDHYYSNVDVL